MLQVAIVSVEVLDGDNFAALAYCGRVVVAAFHGGDVQPTIDLQKSFKIIKLNFKSLKK